MVTLTDIAADKLRGFLAQQEAEGEVGLRVGVRGAETLGENGHRRTSGGQAVPQRAGKAHSERLSCGT